MSFSSGFATGLQAREMRDRREEEKKIRAEMAQVGQAMPEQVATDMPAPVDPSGADPGATTTATRFLGQTYDKPPSQADMLKARTQAMAGVYMRNGNPEAGLRLQQMAQQGVREEARFAQETRRNQRENEAADDESAYRRDLKEFSEKSRLRQNESVYGKAMEDYQSKLRDYQQRQAAGETGPRLGLAPTPPARPEYTMADNLADATGLIALQSRRGKVDPNLLMKFGEMVRSIQSEGVKEATQALQGGAPLDEVARMFNAAGQGKFDVANVVSDKTIQNKDGTTTRLVGVRNPDGSVKTLNSLALLDSIGAAEKEFARAFKRTDDARAERQLDATIQHQRVMEGQSGASLGLRRQEITRAEAEKQATADAAAALYAENTPNATPAQLDAVRRGILSPVPGKGEEVKTDFKANQYGGGGTATQTDRRGNITVTTVDPSGRVTGTQTIPAPGTTPRAATVQAPAGAVDVLRKNPALAEQFDAKYGRGAAAQVLRQP